MLRRIQVAPAVPCLLVMLVLSVDSHAKAHEHFGEGFSIDLDKPYPVVVSIVQEVIDDGLIRGASEYKGTRDLDGATSAKQSKAFPAWTGEGKVFFKVRSDTLAPDHFHESNDKGTVTVRYIVQSLGPNSTRLRIDAVFVEDSHHHSHTSDGSVESNEFVEISDKLKDLEDLEQKHASELAHQQEVKKLEELKATLDQETAKLQALEEKEKQLENQLRVRQSGVQVRIRTARADLKAEPYTASNTIQTLPQGELLTVRLRTANWWRVQASDGTQGWIYRLLLEESK
jgi:Bacterial SH3 domain